MAATKFKKYGVDNVVIVGPLRDEVREEYKLNGWTQAPLNFNKNKIPVVSKKEKLKRAK